MKIFLRRFRNFARRATVFLESGLPLLVVNQLYGSSAAAEPHDVIPKSSQYRNALRYPAFWDCGAWFVPCSSSIR